MEGIRDTKKRRLPGKYLRLVGREISGVGRISNDVRSREITVLGLTVAYSTRDGQRDKRVATNSRKTKLKK